MSQTVSRLKQATRGKLKEAPRILIFGSEGVGKSTFAAASPSPIWLDIEGGSGRLDVTRYPFHDGESGHMPTCYQDVINAVQDLTVNEHAHQTVVIDTVDRLESLIWKQVLSEDTKHKPKSIEEYGGGYGKGYVAAVDKWREFCALLEEGRKKRNLTWLLLSHAQVKAFKNPVMESYDRYTMRMNDKAAGFLREWSDIVGFACFEETTSNLFADERTRGVSTGRRLLKLERSAAHDAKSRYPMPAQVEMSLEDPWAPFAKALSEAQDMTSDQLCAEIMKEAERIGGDVTMERAKQNTEKYKTDVPTLQRVLEKMREKQKGE